MMDFNVGTNLVSEPTESAAWELGISTRDHIGGRVGLEWII